jgi:hypothetical protein
MNASEQDWRKGTPSFPLDEAKSDGTLEAGFPNVLHLGRSVRLLINRKNGGKIAA